MKRCGSHAFSLFPWLRHSMRAQYSSYSTVIRTRRVMVWRDQAHSLSAALRFVSFPLLEPARLRQKRRWAQFGLSTADALDKNIGRWTQGTARCKQPDLPFSNQAARLDGQPTGAIADVTVWPEIGTIQVSTKDLRYAWPFQMGASCDCISRKTRRDLNSV